MTILYVRCTEGQLLRRRVELSSMYNKNMHRVSSIVLLVIASQEQPELKYAAEVNAAEIHVTPRSASTSHLDINVKRYTKRPLTEHHRAYARSTHKHILTQASQRAELCWSK